MKTFKEFHLANGKKVILKNPVEKGGFVTGDQVKSRTDVTTVHGSKEAITKTHIIGKSAIKKSIDLHHNLNYDELEEKYYGNVLF